MGGMEGTEPLSVLRAAHQDTATHLQGWSKEITWLVEQPAGVDSGFPAGL